jgi:hypothetical protein
MKARFIRKLSPHTMLFSCEPPMVFLSDVQSTDPTVARATKESHLVVSHFDAVAPGLDRVVLHSAGLLAGESDENGGIAYGAPLRVMDGLDGGVSAMRAAGYNVVWPKDMGGKVDLAYHYTE